MTAVGTVRYGTVSNYQLWGFFYLKKLRLHSLSFLALIVVAQCALNSFKSQLRFAYYALGFQIAFCFCGATFLKLCAHPCQWPPSLLQWRSWGRSSWPLFCLLHPLTFQAPSLSRLSWPPSSAGLQLGCPDEAVAEALRKAILTLKVARSLSVRLDYWTWVNWVGRGQVAGCSWPCPLIFNQVYGFCSFCKACGLKAVQIFQKMACWVFSFRRVNNWKILLFHGPDINLTVRGKVRTVRQGIWNIGSERMSCKKICLSINVLK